MVSEVSSCPPPSEARAHTRLPRIRRRIGFVLLGLCFAVPGWFAISGPSVWNLRLEPWLSWTWELPGPLRYAVLLLYPAAVLILLPVIGSTLNRGRALTVLLGVGTGCLLVFAGMVTAIVVIAPLPTGLRFVQLTEPGIFERAVIQSRGTDSGELYVDLWVVRQGSDEFEVILAGTWGDWPFEVRMSPHGPRYLVVDARLRASRLLDLTTDTPVIREEPSIEELRSEFGEDIRAIATRDG